MKKYFLLFVLLITIISGGCGSDSSSDTAQQPSSTNYKPGDVLVVFAPPDASAVISAANVEEGVYSSYMTSIAEVEGCSVGEVFGALSQQGNGLFAVLHTAEGTEQETVERLKTRPDVMGAGLNWKFELTEEITPNDTQYDKLWGLKAVKAPEAWESSTGSEDVYVAVIDSGIDYTHPDLTDNFETEGYSKNCMNANLNGDYSDENGHGTHVAGTIGAVGNNGKGVVGMNWNTKLISLRIFDKDGNGGSSETMIRAISYLLGLLSANQNLKIASVNMSLGVASTGKPDSFLNDPYYLAFKALDDTNRTTMCIAAANDGKEIKSGHYIYPACFPLNNKIVVASAKNTSNYSRSDFSNWSKTYVDIAAPGDDIISTAPQQSTLNTQNPMKLVDENGDKYLTISGTSMATPHVAGAVVLLASKYPQATPAELKTAILLSADKNYATDYTKCGFLDVKSAFAVLESKYPTPPDEPVTGVSIDEEHFPDAIFRSHVSSKYDTNKDGILSRAEAEEVTSMYLAFTRPLSDLKGIKHFTALQRLSFHNNNLISLDVSGCTALTYLSCEQNQLTELNVSGCTGLTTLFCGGNKLTKLDVSECSALTYLSCDGNQLTELDVSKNTALTNLLCVSNQLTTLNVSGCSVLNQLLCYDNRLTVLDISDCPEIRDYDRGLYYFHCDVDVRVIRMGITTTSLKNGTVNKSYSVTLKASGKTPITWVAAGLPTGLTIDSGSGKISGTPTEYGTFTGTFTASNAYGSSTKILKLTIVAPPTITTASLKNATLKKSYSVALKASGTTPITWSATGLPKGLSIAKGSNVISGTPTKSGSFDVKITAKNSHGSSTKTLSLFVGIAPSITTKTLKNATLKKAYSVTLKASGTAPITWTATGLPAGLTIDSNTGKISGNPTGSGSFDVNFTAKNSYGTSTKTLSLFVGVAPSITTKTLKNATLKKAYSVTLKASGTAPITWTATGLPKGLSIAKGSNVISGTPTKSGSFDVKITAKNSHGSNTKTLSLFVGVAPSITTSSLKNATLNKSYSVTLKASGTTPVTWSAKGLPAGLTIDSSTGKISGTPTKSGSSSVKITAKNSHGSNTKTLKLFVGIPASITTKSVTYGLAGKSYSVALKANGTAAITWSIKSGNLPEGLTLAENGKISGKPTKSGTSAFTVIAKNAYGSSTKKFTLKVYALPNITTATLKSGTVGKSYSVTLKATGSGTITWFATGLPSGLSINKSNGKISGKPKVSGVFTVSVKAASTYGSKTKKFSLTISDASSTAENYTEDYSSTTTLQTLSGTARVQAALSTTTQTESYFIAYVFDDVISVDKAGLYDFDVQLDGETPEGWPLVWIANSDKPSDDDEIADFFDCEGAPIEVVSHDKKISVSVWLNPNCVYEPAIAAIKQQ